MRPVGLVLAAGDGQIEVSWTASATTPAAGFGYRVQWKLASQTWDQVASQYKDLRFGANLAKWHAIGGLVNGSAYDVRVAAYSAGGFSTWATGSATPTKPKAGAPAAALGLKLAAGDGEIAVSWSASATTAVAGFGYRVQWKPAASKWGDAEVRSADLVHGSNLATSHTITGLANGSAYDVRVAAYSAGGVSNWISGSATPKAPAPDPASGLKLVAGDKQIAVSWSASTTTAVAGFGYRVQWKPAAKAWGDTATESADLVHGSNLATSHTISGLSNGSAYVVRVAAYSADGFSAWVSGRAIPVPPPPGPPSGLSLVAGHYRIEVSWSASSTTPAAGFGYRVQWKPAADKWGDAAVRSADLAHGSNLATSYTTGWVVNGSVYDVRVAAYNYGGVSEWIAGQATPVPPDPPEAASGLKLAAGDGEIAVSWTASTTTPADGFRYRVEWKPADKTWGGAGDSFLLAEGSDLATSYTISGLVNGSAYDVRVAAYNYGGLSEWIAGQATPAAPKTPAKPEAASGLKLTASDKQIAVSWTASTTTPADGFGYRVQWKPAAKEWDDADAQSTDLAHGSNLATSHTIGGLANGSAYDVRVAAYNAGGVSDWVTGQATPAAPKTAAPAWAYSTVGYATLDECTDNAGTRWCGYHSGLWYVDSRD